MSILRLRIDIIAELDKDNYTDPVDGKLVVSLQEDIQEALETKLPIEIESIKITRTK